MKLLKKLTILFSIALLAFSCQNDDDPEMNQNPGEQPTSGNTTETSLTDEVDRTFFKQIKEFGDVYAKKEFIDDYNFLNYPMYFILKTSTGKFEKGFVINPLSTLGGATKLGANENFGLNIYRFDQQIEDAVSAINKGNGLYDFDYTIDGKSNYYLQFYEEIGVRGLNGLSNITTASHEAFHDFYQTKDASTNSKWDNRFNSIQEQENFPVTKELLELQILNTEILKELPNTTNVVMVRNKMKQYIAIKSRELELDPSQSKLILNMEIEQERIEGSAHYIEILASREFSSLNANDPSFVESGTSALNSNESFFTPLKGHLPLTHEINSKASLKEVMSLDIAYPVGASVIYGINILDRDKVQLINTQTPYKIISDIIGLNDNDKKLALEAAKSSVNWKKIQDRATQLVNLN